MGLAHHSSVRKFPSQFPPKSLRFAPLFFSTSIQSPGFFMATANPSLDLQDRVTPPCAIVIFGASGDLTKRKLVPALFRLYQEKLLPEQFAIVGISRSAMSHEEFRQRMEEAINKTATIIPTTARIFFAKLSPFMLSTGALSPHWTKASGSDLMLGGVQMKF